MQHSRGLGAYAPLSSDAASMKKRLNESVFLDLARLRLHALNRNLLPVADVELKFHLRFSGTHTHFITALSLA